MSKKVAALVVLVMVASLSTAGCPNNTKQTLSDGATAPVALKVSSEQQATNSEAIY